MFDESKLIFYTGAPGSKWSVASHIIAHNTKYPINKSDYREDRIFQHSTVNICHYGAYFGPGNEFGKQFDNISLMSKNDIINQIDLAYSDKSWDKYRIVKCHHFSLNLEFIKETFPSSKIIIVLRPDTLCYQSWVSAGGFEKISYPNYLSYYKNLKILEEKIIEENESSRNFIDKYNLNLHVVRKKYWNEYWNLKLDTEELQRYSDSLEKGIGERFRYDTLTAHYNFNS